MQPHGRRPVVPDEQHHRIVLHIARIERRYVVVWPREGQSAETPSVTAPSKMALERLRAYALPATPRAQSSR